MLLWHSLMVSVNYKTGLLLTRVKTEVINTSLYDNLKPNDVQPAHDSGSSSAWLEPAGQWILLRVVLPLQKFYKKNPKIRKSKTQFCKKKMPKKIRVTMCVFFFTKIRKCKNAKYSKKWKFTWDLWPLHANKANKTQWSDWFILFIANCALNSSLRSTRIKFIRSVLLLY